MIITGTVKDIIIFLLSFNQKRYDFVVNACSLNLDLNSMPLADLTKVGEMGMSLSGGQRSRISLARALYRQDSTVILIDSTFSSLDAIVSR